MSRLIEQPMKRQLAEPPEQPMKMQLADPP
jgi:hypothetical protein